MVGKMGKEKGGLIMNATSPLLLSLALQWIHKHTHSPEAVSESSAVLKLFSFFHIHDFTFHVLKFYWEKETNCLPNRLTYFLYDFYSLAELMDASLGSSDDVEKG